MYNSPIPFPFVSLKSNPVKPSINLKNAGIQLVYMNINFTQIW